MRTLVRAGLTALLALTALAVPTAASAAPSPQQVAAAAGVTCNFAEPVAFQSVWTGKWVATEKDYTGTNHGMLRANRSSIGNWEKFYLCHRADFGYDEFAFLADANAQFVTAEFDYSGSNDGMMRARSSVVDVWQRFDLEQVFNPGYPNEVTYALRSTWTGMYATTEVNYTGTRQGMMRVRPNSNYVDVWQIFRMRWLA
jgi:hypothetical protein